MKFFSKLERKFGRYAIHNLMLYIIIINAAGFIMSQLNYQLLLYVCWDMPSILKGQIWRLITFMMWPFETNAFSFLLFAIVYYSIGNALERTWGTFRFNVYVFTGLIGHILAGILMYVLFDYNMINMNTSYLNTSLFLALAMTYPDIQFLLFFIIPIKAKWMGIFSAALLLINLISGGTAQRVMIIMSLINFVIFAFIYGKNSRFNPKDVIRRRQFHQKIHQAQNQAAGHPMHKCAICGRTDKDFPNLEFRYCSKCAGAYEYCSEHLYTHVHIIENLSNNK